MARHIYTEVEVEAMKVIGGGGSGFIPSDPKQKQIN